jgi:hypothetical protein
MAFHRQPGAQKRVIPRSMGQPPKSVRDICFTLVESADLRRFTGTWRIESREDMRCRLIYAVEVLPQPWLPVGTCRSSFGVGPSVEWQLTAPRTLASTPRHWSACISGLIAQRISADLTGNLAAVRDHAESLSVGAVALPPRSALTRGT